MNNLRLAWMVYGRATAATCLTLMLYFLVMAFAYDGTVTIDFNHYGEHTIETGLVLLGAVSWFWTGGLTNVEGV